MAVAITTLSLWRATILWRRIRQLKPRHRQETGVDSKKNAQVFGSVGAYEFTDYSILRYAKFSPGFGVGGGF